MNARSTLGIATTLVAALSLVPPLAAQEEEEGMQEELTLTLEPKNDSGISGTVAVRDAPDAMGGSSHAVVLELSGVEAGMTYAAHVHQGTCETGGGVVTALTAVAAEGSMASSTTVLTAEQIASLEAAHGGMTDMARTTDDDAEDEEGEDEEAAGGSLFIQVHAPDGTPAACADIPAMEHDDGGSN